MSTSTPPKHDLSALKIDREEEETRSAGPLIKWGVVLLVMTVIGWAIYARVIAPRGLRQVELLTVQPSLNVQSQQQLTASGYLVADRSATLAPKIAGRITRVNFDVGSEVKRGDVLVVLESGELQAQLREAQADYADASREFNRQNALWKEGVASRALLDSAEARMKMSAARIERLRVVIRDMVVRSPFSGTVTSKGVEVGEMVTPMAMGQSPAGGATDAIATIADLSTLEVEVDVNENNLGKLRVGHPAEITVDAFPGRKFQGQLRKIIPTANRAKGVVQVRVAIMGDKQGLLPEMSSSVSFLEREKTATELAERPGIWISPSALVTNGSSSFVLATTPDNRVKRRPVTLGDRRDGRVEVVEGLKAGDRIIAEVEGIEEGARVRVAPEEEK